MIIQSHNKKCSSWSLSLQRSTPISINSNKQVANRYVCGYVSGGHRMSWMPSHTRMPHTRKVSPLCARVGDSSMHSSLQTFCRSCLSCNDTGGPPCVIAGAPASNVHKLYCYVYSSWLIDWVKVLSTTRHRSFRRCSLKPILAWYGT